MYKHLLISITVIILYFRCCHHTYCTNNLIFYIIISSYKQSDKKTGAFWFINEPFTIGSNNSLTQNSFTYQSYWSLLLLNNFTSFYEVLKLTIFHIGCKVVFWIKIKTTNSNYNFNKRSFWFHWTFTQSYSTVEWKWSGGIWRALGQALLFGALRAWCHLERRGVIIWEAKG